jgi:hypothetical protein
MEKDFHYYCVAVMARAAGFRAEDALTIGYASQYVDDATEGETIQVGSLLFDPVRTAHYGLKAYDWSVQKRVYFPFHFLPSTPMATPDASFVTTPDSSLAQALLAEVQRTPAGLLRLCWIGVALHAYADTWAHQGFSGRDDPENDVVALQVRTGGRWKRLSQHVIFDCLPSIAHVQAGHLPDQPFAEWRCERPAAASRNNQEQFFSAAAAIYGWLKSIAQPPYAPTPWNALAPKIRALFAVADEDTERRCEQWQDRFADLFGPKAFAYEAQAWREEALGPAPPLVASRDPGEPVPTGPPRYELKPGFLESPWVQFHRAALRQRHFVLEHLV